jgi:hypothetical protein
VVASPAMTSIADIIGQMICFGTAGLVQHL